MASPTEEETIQILRGIKDRYEKFHHVTYRDEALEAAVYQSSRYITDRFLPDKAIDLLDEAGSRVKLRDAAAVEETPEFSRKIRVVVDRSGRRPSAAPPSSATRKWPSARTCTSSASTGTWAGRAATTSPRATSTTWSPSGRASPSPRSRKRSRPSSCAWRRSCTGASSRRRTPSARWRAPSAARAPASRTRTARWARSMFLGPDRGGEDRGRAQRWPRSSSAPSARSSASTCPSTWRSTRSASSSARRPATSGHEEGGQLTERVKRNPYSVVLLDEIEKAHPDVFNILLQVFEDGHLTDGLGNTIDFKNTILIMTSNIGARFIEKKGRMGFASQRRARTPPSSVNEMVMGEVKRTFNPEFINRVDEIIIFDALTDDDLEQHHAPARGAAEPEPQGEGDHRQHPRRGRGLAAAQDPLRPLVRRAARCAAPSSATSRTRSPRPSSAGQIRPQRPIEIGVRGRRPLVLAGRPRRRLSA